jgi:hypothetical protein
VATDATGTNVVALALEVATAIGVVAVGISLLVIVSGVKPPDNL